MKTKLIITALLAIGLSTTPLLAQSSEQILESTETTISQDKVKLEPQDLPQTIKESIANDDEISGLQITEAWQVTDENGSMYYHIKFDEGGDEVEKKYNAQGEEIED